MKASGDSLRAARNGRAAKTETKSTFRVLFLAVKSALQNVFASSLGTDRVVQLLDVGGHVASNHPTSEIAGGKKRQEEATHVANGYFMKEKVEGAVIAALGMFELISNEELESILYILSSISQRTLH